MDQISPYGLFMEFFKLPPGQVAIWNGNRAEVLPSGAQHLLANGDVPLLRSAQAPRSCDLRSLAFPGMSTDTSRLSAQKRAREESSETWRTGCA